MCIRHLHLIIDCALPIEITPRLVFATQIGNQHAPLLQRPQFWFGATCGSMFRTASWQVCLGLDWNALYFSLLLPLANGPPLPSTPFFFRARRLLTCAN